MPTPHLGYPDSERHAEKGTEMSVLSRKTKAKIGVKTAKQAAKHPKLALEGAHVAAPVVKTGVKLKTRRQREQGRKALWIISGIAIGAIAMYLAELVHARRRRAEHADDVSVEAGGPAHPAPGHLPPDREPELHHH